jgi:uncharacterized protein (TIGR02145 family)
MKKNFLIMLLTVFCVSFAFAQVETVNGFVPGAGTGAATNDDESYGVVGQVFGVIAGGVYEVAEGHAQMQLVADTLPPIILICGEGINVYPFSIKYNAETIRNFIPEDAILDTVLTMQFPNVAEYNYDSLYVLHVVGCNCKVKDYEENRYDVLVVNNICWTKPNLQSKKDCEGADVEFKQYSTESTPALDPNIMGYLYTWDAATKGENCGENNDEFIQGICPCGWHIPTQEEMAMWLSQSANALRDNDPDNWIAGQSTNTSLFAAQPAGYFNSVTNRFEGYTTEADFWYVGAECTPASMQILYYCNVPMTLPRNPADALSVRCAKDLNHDIELIRPTNREDYDGQARTEYNVARR